MGVGMPQGMLLRDFGDLVHAAFDEVGYHVGSSLRQKDGWRDVDVRVMLDDETYAAAGYGDPERPQQNAKWCAMVLAWSALGRQMTGLPFDFQIQQRTHANTKYAPPESPRSALFALHDRGWRRSGA